MSQSGEMRQKKQILTTIKDPDVERCKVKQHQQVHFINATVDPPVALHFSDVWFSCQLWKISIPHNSPLSSFLFVLITIISKLRKPCLFLLDLSSSM